MVAFVLLLFSVLCLRAAVPGVVANGERYKSVFDLYRNKLNMQVPTSDEKDKWDRLAGQQQYLEKDEREPIDPQGSKG